MTYEKMKAKQKNLIRQRSYFSYLLTALCSAFKWTLPEGVEERWIERYLHISGNFGVQKTTDKGYLVAECPSRVGDLDQYGDGKRVEGVTRGNGYQIAGEFGTEVLMCYNNSDRMPDLDLIRYADGFSQVDKAIMANVRWSILAPVLCSKDDKTTKRISELVDDMLDGKLKCITSEDVLEALNGSRGDGVYSIDITHPERIKNVQYQSELYDVLLRRFFNKYGLNIQNSSKHAQASTDEVHGLDAVSWVLILDMLKERQEFCKQATALWGDTWDCVLSDVWQSEYDRFIIRNKQADNADENSLEGDENNDKNMGETGNDSSDSGEGDESGTETRDGE